MTLSNTDKRELKAKAHKLKPVVLIGSNGLTDSVRAEIDSSLLAHELIKIKISTQDREALKEISNEICEKVNAELVQSIGHVIVIYRKNDK